MNILLIEDEKKVADFVRRGLSAEGWNVDHAEDGETGLQFAQSGVYDVILLDVMLPGIQGTDVCRKLSHVRQKTYNHAYSARRTRGEGGGVALWCRRLFNKAVWF